MAGWQMAHGLDIAPDTPGAQASVVRDRLERLPDIVYYRLYQHCQEYINVGFSI